MTAAEVIADAVDAFGITAEQLVNHDQRTEDVMDARAMVVWVLENRLEYSIRRAAAAVGYKVTPANAGESVRRLRRRVAERPRLRAQIDRRFPEWRAA